MNLWIFSIMWNEAKMAPWFARHYSSFADRIITFVESSADGTEKILRQFPKVEVRRWPFRGLDDNRFLEAVNNWMKEARGKSDWVAWVDADELLYHPNMRQLLEKPDGDIFESIGYALISPTGWPESQVGQIYDHVRTGVRQSNYDKLLLHRSGIDVIQTIGRHAYPGQFPKHKGKISSEKIKLLHCHCLGGVDYTAQRNRRNYGRAIDKKFAWNFADEHNFNPKQSGSVAWVKDAIENDRLFDVFSGEQQVSKVTGLKLHLGCGGIKFEGWCNHDMDVDLKKPLPFGDGSASHIYCSHVIEHLSHQEAWNFFVEAHRVLSTGGILRLAIPDFTKLERDLTKEYQNAVKAGGHGDGSRMAALKACVFEHGHRSTWNSALLRSFLKALNFTVSAPAYAESSDPVLQNLERHGVVVGEGVARTETSCVEARK